MRAITSPGSNTLGSVAGAAITSDPLWRPGTLPAGREPRGTGLAATPRTPPTGEQPRDHRQTSTDRAGRHRPARLREPHHSPYHHYPALRGDEPEHVGRRNRRGRLADHREERPQIRTPSPAPCSAGTSQPRTPHSEPHLSPPRRTYNSLQRRHPDLRSATSAPRREAARSLTRLPEYLQSRRQSGGAKNSSAMPSGSRKLNPNP